MFQLNDNEIKNFKRAFDLFDKDGNGSINRQEITIVFRELNIRLTESEIDQVMKQFDQNGDQCISFDQFLIVLSTNIDKTESETWIFQTFQIMDQDCDGLLNKNQLKKVVELFGIDISEKQIDQILECSENQGEKGLNYEQFSDLLRFK